MRNDRRLVSLPGRRGETPTIVLRLFEDTAEALRQSVKALRGTSASARGHRANLEAVRALLTWPRLTLLRTIRTDRPTSIAALARAVHRSPDEVTRDLEVLAQYGLVELRTAGGKSRTRVPVVGYDAFEIRVEIR